MPRTFLVTGFEPFGGRDLNPSALVAQALDGTRIGDLEVVGRVLPVDLERVAGSIQALLDELEPLGVIATGLAPGYPTIALERFGANLADFPLPDNAGALARDLPLVEDGPTALASRLPLRAIEAELLDAGIPVVLSESAGLYLCNAAMYHLLTALDPSVPAGFIHLPAIPAQVVEKLRGPWSEGQTHASMELATIERAIRIAVEHTVRAAVAAPR
jgi:pyroglutamyl-peptidase